MPLNYKHCNLIASRSNCWMFGFLMQNKLFIYTHLVQGKVADSTKMVTAENYLCIG